MDLERHRLERVPTPPATGAEAGDGRGLVWEPQEDVGMAACVAIVSAALTSGLVVVRLLFG